MGIQIVEKFAVVFAAGAAILFGLGSIFMILYREMKALDDK
jgi:hypothetical protein